MVQREPRCRVADVNPLTSSNVSNTAIVVQSAGVNPASVIFTNSGTAHGGVDYTFSDTVGSTVGIAGSTGLTLQGTGNVTLLGPNTFSGAVSIQAGQLIVQNSGGWRTTGVAVTSGGALTLSGGVSLGTVPLSLAGAGVAGNTAGALDTLRETISTVEQSRSPQMQRSIPRLPPTRSRSPAALTPKITR